MDLLLTCNLNPNNMNLVSIRLITANIDAIKKFGAEV